MSSASESTRVPNDVVVMSVGADELTGCPWARLGSLMEARSRGAVSTRPQNPSHDQFRHVPYLHGLRVAETVWFPEPGRSHSGDAIQVRVLVVPFEPCHQRGDLRKVGLDRSSHDLGLRNPVSESDPSHLLLRLRVKA